MRYILFWLTLFSLFFKMNYGQDSVSYSKDFRLYEGLYLNYQDLRYNWPISKEKIITAINKDQLDFYSKILEFEFIEFTDRDGSVTKIKSERVWGYCQNNVIFLNMDKNFFRIPVFGAISNFIGTVEVTNYSPGYDPFMNVPMNNTMTKTREIRQYLFDFYTGEVIQFNSEKLEEFLKRDEVVYKEFMTLSKKKKKELATKYIRMYNERHPVYFPKG